MLLLLSFLLVRLLASFLCKYHGDGVDTVVLFLAGSSVLQAFLSAKAENRCARANLCKTFV